MTDFRRHTPTLGEVYSVRYCSAVWLLTACCLGLPGGLGLSVVWGQTLKLFEEPLVPEGDGEAIQEPADSPRLGWRRFLDRQLVGTHFDRLFAVEISPRYEDIAIRDGIAVDFRIGGGLTDNWLVSTRLRSYVNNPLSDDDQAGL